MKKIIMFIVGALLLVGILLNFIPSGSSNTAMSQYDKAMASQDWGPDYYYNSGTHKVEKKVHLFR